MGAQYPDVPVAAREAAQEPGELAESQLHHAQSVPETAVEAVVRLHHFRAVCGQPATTVHPRNGFWIAFFTALSKMLRD